MSPRARGRDQFLTTSTLTKQVFRAIRNSWLCFAALASLTVISFFSFFFFFFFNIGFYWFRSFVCLSFVCSLKFVEIKRQMTENRIVFALDPV